MVYHKFNFEPPPPLKNNNNNLCYITLLCTFYFFKLKCCTDKLRFAMVTYSHTTQMIQCFNFQFYILGILQLAKLLSNIADAIIQNLILVYTVKNICLFHELLQMFHANIPKILFFFVVLKF